MNCQGAGELGYWQEAGYSLGYFTSLFMGIWQLRRFGYTHLPQPGEGQGELLAFAFARILVVFTFGVAFVVFGICSCLHLCLVGGVHGPGGTQ